MPPCSTFRSGLKSRAASESRLPDLTVSKGFPFTPVTVAPAPFYRLHHASCVQARRPCLTTQPTEWKQRGLTKPPAAHLPSRRHWPGVMATSSLRLRTERLPALRT